MRIGVFGGTFDPIHLGHLITAEQCREQGRLDQVWFVPSAHPPHKQDLQITPFARRVEMLQLAIAGNRDFQIDEMENDLGGLSYTVRTLRELRTRHPSHEWRLILGADCLPELRTWREPVGIVSQAALLVVARPHFPLWTAQQLRESLALDPNIPLDVQTIQIPQIDIASRDIRTRIRENRSIRYLLPRAVECYIQQQGLYRSVS